MDAQPLRGMKREVVGPRRGEKEAADSETAWPSSAPFYRQARPERGWLGHDGGSRELPGVAEGGDGRPNRHPFDHPFHDHD